MALYEYECEQCGEHFELIQKFSDEPLTRHDKCGGPVHRLISAPALQFKGSGWYITDYAKGGSSSGNGSPPKSESSDSSKSGSDSRDRAKTGSDNRDTGKSGSDTSTSTPSATTTSSDTKSGSSSEKK